MIKKLKLGHVLALGLMFWLWVRLVDPVQAIFWGRVKISGFSMRVNFSVVDWQFQVYVDDQLINEQFNQPDFSLNQSQLEINLHQKVRNVCFDYQINSYDQPPFDNPVLNLSVNSKPVFQAESLDLSDQNYQTEWQKIGLDLSEFDQPQIQFSSFDSLDNFNPSFINIKNLTSQCGVINPENLIKLEVNPQADIFYQIKPIGESVDQNDWQTYIQPFNLSGLTSGWYQIYYYAQGSEIKSLLIFFQADQPSLVENLELMPTDQSVLISWPNDYQPVNYQFGFWPGSCEQFASLVQTGHQIQNQPFYNLEIEGLNSQTDYCLSVRSCHQSGWCSQPVLYTFHTF